MKQLRELAKGHRRECFHLFPLTSNLSSLFLSLALVCLPWPLSFSSPTAVPPLASLQHPPSNRPHSPLHFHTYRLNKPTEANSTFQLLIVESPQNLQFTKKEKTSSTSNSGWPWLLSEMYSNSSLLKSHGITLLWS